MVSELIIAGIVSFILGAFGALFGGLIMWRWQGPKIVDRSISGKVGPAIYSWLITPSLTTGKKKKLVDKETGEETESEGIISPFENLIGEAGKLTYQLICSKTGVDARKKQIAIGDVQSALSDPNSPLAGLSSLIPQKLVDRAIKDGDYVPVILQMFGPQIGQYINTLLPNRSGVRTGGELQF